MRNNTTRMFRNITRASLNTGTRSDVPSPNPLAHLFVDSAHNAGLKLNSDFNGKDQEGVGLNQWTASGGLRCSTYPVCVFEC